MSTFKYIKNRSLKDDIEMARIGHKKAGRRNRIKAYRAAKKHLYRVLDKTDFN